MDFSAQLCKTMDHARDALELTITEMAHDPLARMSWIKSQLRTLILKLETMFLDIDAGQTPFDFGFENSEDFTDMLNNIDKQIGDLKSLIKTVQLGR